MANFVFNILVFLTVGVYADALECTTGNQFQCTAFDTTFSDECEQFEARNQAFTTQRCLATQDKCILIASGLSFEDKYDLQFITAGCGSGILDGCYDRDDLLAMNPTYGEIGPQAFIRTQWGDDFRGPGYEYDSLDTCACTDNCIDQEKLSEYRKNFGNSNAVTTGLHLGGYFLVSTATFFSLFSSCML